MGKRDENQTHHENQYPHGRKDVLHLESEKKFKDHAKKGGTKVESYHKTRTPRGKG